MKLLLIHGIFLNPVLLSSLASKLEEEGHEVVKFGYPFFPKETDLHELYLQAVTKERPNAIIGHSLGGKLAVKHVGAMPNSVSHIVCLGSPLRRSASAHKVSEKWFIHPISDAAKTLLLEDIALPETTIKVGMIAGNNDSLGVNLIVQALSSPHDGAVALYETDIPGLHDHIEVKISHTRLIFSAEVAKQTHHFLVNNRFHKN